MEAVDGDPGPQEGLSRAVWAVYGVAPAEFVSVRKEWVTRLKAAGHRDVAKEIGALRKPSVSADAINTLVRAGDPVVGLLVNVGTRLRHAQAALDAGGMAALREERDEVLAAWVAAARAHSLSGSLTSGVEAEVRDTGVAALADAAATEVATSGSLTRALSYSGFGEVDVADAVARTSTGVVLTRIQGGRDDAEDPDSPDTDPIEETEHQDEPLAMPVAVPVADPDPDSGSGVSGSDSDASNTERVAELEMELDECEKAVAAARAARREAAEVDTAADREATVAAEQVAQAERLLAGARKQLDRATEAREEAAALLVAAQEDIVTTRQARDAARAALEEAEDG
ncbi:MAG: hypothetical protein Q4P07_02530 [Ornithinimicrobium sp.]|uniref:hypothetical protein n=1 Tax=Ornithinimicrobium sp. TaxID=1977084 RepID=UPI0026DF683A|nr:hypothetical protein [Ornithinimicrobium sp.]MDO5739004.1 hypothetical protein [Ornithinimicrobium sp.]